MTQVDVTTFLGGYPFRDIGPWHAAALLDEMTRVGTTESWVSHLPAIYARDPESGNAELYAASSLDRRLKPVPAVHPTGHGWIAALDEAVTRRAPAVRSDPTLHGAPPHEQAGVEGRLLQ